MADAAKLQKLAAARKKLKGHQNKKSKVKKQENEAQETSSTHSSESYNQPAQEPEMLTNVNTETTVDENNAGQGPLSSDVLYQVKFTDFFDNLPSPKEKEVNYVSNYDDCNNYNVSNYFTNTPQQIMSNEVAMEDPEINLNMFSNQPPASAVLPPNIFSNESGSFYGNSENIEPKIQNVPIETEVHSSVESLRQLSSQINHYIEPNNSFEDAHNYSDLEKRNLELAALFEMEKLKSEKLNIDLNEYQNRLAHLEKELLSTKSKSEHKLSSELGPLQEQLQYHVQTVGILVGEKAELTALLSQAHLELKQQGFDCEELQARLKTSRSRVADLEKELSNLRNEKNRFDQIGSEQTQEQSKLKIELQNIRESYEEAQRDISELREKLKVVGGENIQLQSTVSNLNSQISLSNVKIQQLSMNGSIQLDSQLESLTQDKLQLEKHINDLNLLLKNAVNERDQASNQYQQYVQQLNTNLSTLGEKLEATTTENENLSKRDQELIRHIGELEKHLQTLQNDHSNFNNNNTYIELKKEHATLQKQIEEFQAVNNHLQEKYDDVISERDDLFKDSESKKELIQRMEENFERMQDNQSDNTKLLATIESDKVAASRAVQQNVQLKQQLQEMEEAFIKMTNHKAELADQLTTEQFKFKELEEKLLHLEHQVTTLADAIVIKDRELTKIRENSLQLNKQLLQQNQLADRLRHYEANEHSSQSLMSDLQNAFKEIELLKQENKELKEHDHQHHGHGHEHHGHDQHLHGSKVNANQEDNLQIEIFNLKQKIDGLQIVNKKLNDELNMTGQVKNKIDDLETGEIVIENNATSINTSSAHDHEHSHGHSHDHPDHSHGHSHEHPEHSDGHLHDHPEHNHGHSNDESEVSRAQENDILSQEKALVNRVNQVGMREKTMNLNNTSLNDLNKELATRQLEAKFMRTMQDIANLQDEKQMLEHIVLQLQGETETIGEYIALYQHQRGVLKQRAFEKEEQLKQLALDREQMKVKLNQLNELIRRLVLEKGAISTNVLEQHEILNKQTNELCDEHARLHKQMTDVGEGVDKKETAEQILALLSEIKTSNLVQPSNVSDTFKPCPWCSGQLITV